jgi:hypothetical protein
VGGADRRVRHTLAEIGWDLYRPFRGVLRERSLSGAARALGITQPTAGRHIVALERALDVALFVRTQKGLVLTEAALGLRTYAEAMESTVASLHRAASGQGGGTRGALRMVRPRQLKLVARSIGRIDLGRFAHQDYLGRRGTPRKLADFANHSVIGYDQPPDLVRNAAFVRLLPKSFSLQPETWVTMHEDLRNVRRCRVAFEALVEGLQQYAADPAKPRR